MSELNHHVQNRSFSSKHVVKLRKNKLIPLSAREYQTNMAPLLETINGALIANYDSDDDGKCHKQQSIDHCDSRIIDEFDDEDEDEDHDYDNNESNVNDVQNVRHMNNNNDNDLQMNEKMLNKNQYEMVSNDLTKSGHGVELPRPSRVRFNSDVQVTNVSPRQSPKSSITTNSFPSFNFHQYHQIKFHGSQMPNEIVYDEVNGSDDLDNINNANESVDNIIKNSSNGNSRILRDLSGVELLKQKRKQQQLISKKKYQTNEQDSICSTVHYTNLLELQVDEEISTIRQPSSHVMNRLENIGQTHLQNHHTPSSSSSTHKSILKDPLCSKLRSAIRKGQFEVSATSQLESEIDSLLHGSVPGTSTKVPFMKKQLPSSKCSNNRMNSHNIKVNSKANKSESLLSCDGPCNSYIKMIEEKYRHKASSNTSNAILSSKGKSSKSKQTTNNKGNKLMQNESAPMGKQAKSVKTNEFGYRNHNHHQTMFTHTTMDQLMNTIMMESRINQGNKPNRANVLSSAIDTMDQRQSKSTSMDCNNNGSSSKLKSKNSSNKSCVGVTGNEQLYSQFADPISGPNINCLMDQLSRSFATKSTFGQLGQSDSLMIADDGSSCSLKSGTSTISLAKSLVENHIYEEILYEALEAAADVNNKLWKNFERNDDSKEMSANKYRQSTTMARRKIEM